MDWLWISNAAVPIVPLIMNMKSGTSDRTPDSGAVITVIVSVTVDNVFFVFCDIKYLMASRGLVNSNKNKNIDSSTHTLKR